MEIVRTVTAITPAEEKEAPAIFGPGQSARLFRSCCLGDKRLWSQTRSCRFQNANEAPPRDAQNVTESRKSCEVPSCGSFPQVPKERHASSDIEFFLVRA